jgi:DNA polymerase III subunit chi
VLVDFYHLTAAPLERVLPRICERLLEQGQRLLVVAEAPLPAVLDGQLWSYAREAFLPHGMAGEPGADGQPILLSPTVEPLNDARNVALADGIWREEALSFERIFYFFDSERIDGARSTWTRLKEREGLERRYWKQSDTGKWVQGP